MGIPLRSEFDLGHPLDPHLVPHVKHHRYLDPVAAGVGNRLEQVASRGDLPRQRLVEGEQFGCQPGKQRASSKLGHPSASGRLFRFAVPERSLVATLDELLAGAEDPDAAAEIRDLPGYKRLQQYKALQQIVCIENKDPEIVTGPFDFSRKRIEQRMEAGYRDADEALEAVEKKEAVGGE